jgi:hypothetical protein
MNIRASLFKQKERKKKRTLLVALAKLMREQYCSADLMVEALRIPPLVAR